MSLDTTLSFIQKMTQGVQGNEADDVALQLLQKMQRALKSYIGQIGKSQQS